MRGLYVTLSALLVVGNAFVPPANPLIHKVLETTQKLLDFFSEDYSNINVDGLFGLRIGQGQLRDAIRECNERSCDYHVLQKIKQLDKKLDVAANAALPYLQDADPAYYERFLGTINKPYMTPYEPQEFTEEPGPIGYLSSYDEERGDACYSRMLGTFHEGGRILPSCNITHQCWDFMTTEGSTDYFITHQLLYLIIIDHMGCREIVEKYVGGKSVREVQSKLCSKIYQESRHLSQEGKVNARKKDLFLEQTVLCGPLGFEDFMRQDWMDMVLSWPDRRLGCFKAYYNMGDLLDLMETSESPYRGRPGSGGPSQDHMRSAYEGSSSNTMRKLLREKQMKDGCLSHTSGLGFGVLCTYLRYLVRYSPMYMM